MGVYIGVTLLCKLPCGCVVRWHEFIRGKTEVSQPRCAHCQTLMLSTIAGVIRGCWIIRVITCFRRSSRNCLYFLKASPIGRLHILLLLPSKPPTSGMSEALAVEATPPERPRCRLRILRVMGWTSFNPQNSGVSTQKLHMTLFTPLLPNSSRPECPCGEQSMLDTHTWTGLVPLELESHR